MSERKGIVCSLDAPASGGTPLGECVAALAVHDSHSGLEVSALLEQLPPRERVAVEAMSLRGERAPEIAPKVNLHWLKVYSAKDAGLRRLQRIARGRDAGRAYQPRAEVAQELATLVMDWICSGGHEPFAHFCRPRGYDPNRVLVWLQRRSLILRAFQSMKLTRLRRRGCDPIARRKKREYKRRRRAAGLPT
jgi:hypothetical protein